MKKKITDKELYKKHRPIGVIIGKGPNAEPPRYLCEEHEKSHRQFLENIYRAIGKPVP